MLPSTAPRPPGVIGRFAASWPGAVGEEEGLPRDAGADDEEREGEARAVEEPVGQRPAHDRHDLTAVEPDHRDLGDEPVDLSLHIPSRPAGQPTREPDRPPDDHRQWSLVQEERADGQGDDQHPDDHWDQVERRPLLRRQHDPGRGDQRQRKGRRHPATDQRPTGQRVVRPEPSVPAEAVDRRHRRAAGQRARDRLGRERDPEQRPQPRSEATGTEQPRLDERERHQRRRLGRHGRREPPPPQVPEDAADGR